MKGQYKARIDIGKKLQMNLKDALKGSTLTASYLYRFGIALIVEDMWEYKKEKQRQQDSKHLKTLRNAAKIHQKCFQTYHDLIANKKKQDMSVYTAQDRTHNLIVIKRKDDPVLPRGKSIDVKPKIIELDRKIGHESVISICEFFIDRDDLAHLVDQVIHVMEVIGYASAEGVSRPHKMHHEA